MSRCLGGAREKEILKRISGIFHNACYCHLTTKGSQALQRERDMF